MRIAAIPGDGIGVEVLPAAVDVIDAALSVSGERIEWTWLDWGCTYFVDNGQMMPSDGLVVLASTTRSSSALSAGRMFPITSRCGAC
jgi:tartrate dehydrogenase/decarboxylase/D-malate dehydrogenase